MADLASLLKQLDLERLGEFFSSAALDRALAYVARVERIELSGNTLQARVQGDAAQPYLVRVRIETREFLGQRSLELATRCSCPVVNRCKHAAALLLAARRDGALAERPRHEVLVWAEGLRERLAEVQRPARRSPSREAVFYLFRRAPYRPDIELALAKARLDDAGRMSGRASDWRNYEQALLKPPAFVREEDLEVFRLYRGVVRAAGLYGLPRIAGAAGLALAEAALATGRACVLAEGEALRPLAAGADRPARLAWRGAEGGMRATVECEPPCELVARSRPMMYFDAQAGLAGRLVLADDEVVAELLELPALNRSELPIVCAALADAAPALPLPAAAGAGTLERIEEPLAARLRVSTLPCWGWRAHRGYARSQDTHGSDERLGYDFAAPLFHYGEASFVPGSSGSIAQLADGRMVEVRRDAAAEQRAWRAFEEVGFRPVRAGWLLAAQAVPAGLYGLESAQAWGRFVAEIVPVLGEAGWQVECPRDFRHRLLLPEAWHARLEGEADGWLELSLGIDLEGRRVDLAPLLHAAFAQDPRWLDARRLNAIDDHEALVVQLEDGSRVALPARRLKPLARTLIDLFDRPGEPLRVSGFDAGRLAEALGEGWRAQGLEALEHWRERLACLATVRPVAPPAGFGVELRGYQREGLAWLQHLAASGLGGILADDMGLGKTAQTLAHLLTEKRAGRLDRPALVVLPTSLVFNWQQEAARYAPQLEVLKLRGSERAEAFARIPAHDICLTTYPLLWRDRDALAAHEYHSLILDEAQTVKNAASQAARAVRSIRARHRLCLTGTPLENHLGELWAQFDFLMPGFLGDAKDFTARWRTPIEKRGDALRRELLARRVAPFILRRRKQDVARELPPKSVVVRTVELEGRQRDLYETVRAAMDARVREEVAAKGFARSQIVILDALLKLRQVCCDPRLLKSEAAAGVRERAKLDLLMAMLPELVEEGHQVLVFSQFAAMLALIEPELRKRGIGYAKLTGETLDREAAVARFQSGEMRVFLVSLKAGGVGLNLTAADTVIHFDPWWNPAAENQATDRAHRIGQTRRVFVYKLVVSGSIEERILALQEKKAALAAGILSDDHEGELKFGADDLAALLAPLPESAADEARAGRTRRQRA